MRNRQLFVVASLFALVLVTMEATGAVTAFHDAFDLDGTLEESGTMSKSASSDWWVNSGAYFHRDGGIGSTVQGRLPQNDYWRKLYASSNPVDTDNGYLPQNIFRFVTRSQWASFVEQVHFRITATNLTDTPERDAWSGILFFSRYLDSNNLYYAGLRQDGAAVIKRKRSGSYTTLAYRKIYPGTYHRWTNPNLLPQSTWVGLRLTTGDETDGSVSLRLEVEDPSLGAGWTPVLETTDTASSRITTAGFAGVRTDYMDVELDDFSAAEGATPPSPESALGLFVYDDALEAPWINASWGASVDFGNAERVYDGTRAIRVDQNAWGALSLHNGSWSQTVDIDPALYESVDFVIHGGPEGVDLAVLFENDQGDSFPRHRYGWIEQNVWKTVTVPMDVLNPQGLIVNRLDIQDYSGMAKTYWVDRVRFVALDGSEPEPTPTPTPTAEPTPTPTPTSEPTPTPTPTATPSLGSVCGDGICEPGESCSTCAEDCAGLSKGKPWHRYCCGDGTAQEAEGNGDICDGNF